MDTLKFAGSLMMLGALALMGCSSTDETASMSAEDRFARAKALFDDEDYLEAITELRAVTLQFPGSAVADDAQFLLGESHFLRGEFLLATYEFGELRRNMPASPFVPDAAFRVAESFYQLSPESKLDQEYTAKAIDELQSFVEYYPASPRAARAGEMIAELTNRLARKSYETATLYATMEYTRAAQIYYDDIIERFHDTEYAPLAYLGKTEVLIARKRYAEAQSQVTRFLELFPNSVLRARAEELKRKTAEGLAGIANAPASKGAPSPGAP